MSAYRDNILTEMAAIEREAKQRRAKETARMNPYDSKTEWEEHDAYARGAAARKAFVSRQQCPYGKDQMAEAIAWIRGFDGDE